MTEDSCATHVTETRLNVSIPDIPIELARQTVYRGDQTAESGKGKGSGVCIYVSNACCISTDITKQ